MRSVRSSNYFEQMKGRGVQAIPKDDSPRQEKLRCGNCGKIFKAPTPAEASDLRQPVFQ